MVQPYRLILWILALLGCLVLVQFNIAGLRDTPLTGLPATFIFPGNDLVVYLRAGQAVAVGQSPYPGGPWRDTAVYHYSPTLAWLLSYFFQGDGLLWSFRWLAYLYLGLILSAYPLAWLIWRRVFEQLQLNQAGAVMISSLPLWLVYSQWFADQNFLNIYTFLLLLDGLLVLALLRQNTWLALVVVLLIAQTKPHHLYPLALPFCLGRWRFGLKLALACLIGYPLVAAVTIAAVGPPLGLKLYQDYFIFLTTIAERYPWSAYYLGYNHSWQSILYWLFGLQPWIPAAVAALRVLTFLPLVWLGWRWWWRAGPVGKQPAVALGLALALHLWAIISLDQLWEVTTAIIVFVYLMALGDISVRCWTLLIFTLFALLGLVQLFGWQIASLFNRPADQFDLTARLPVLMAAALGLYGLIGSVLFNYFQPDS